MRNIVFLFFCLLLHFFFIQQTLAVSFDDISAYPSFPDAKNELTKQWFIYELPAGHSKKDALTIKNISDKPTQVSIYAVDSTTNEVGGLSLKGKDEKKSKIGSWISLEQTVVDLAPQEEKRISFTISIPDDLDIGQYYGGIVVETTNIHKQQLQASGLNVPTRSAIRVYQTVPGIQKKALQLDSLTRHGVWDTQNFLYKQRFQYQITNTGNASSFAKMSIALHNYVFEMGNTTIEKDIMIPKGQTFIDSLEFPIPKFGYFKANARISYTDESGKQIEISSMPLSFVSFPWIESIVILSIVFLFILCSTIKNMYLSFKRNRLALYEVSHGDTILDVQDRTHTPWKKIVAYNQLQKPYVLIPGTVLYVHCLPEDMQEVTIDNENSEEYEETQEIQTHVEEEDLSETDTPTTISKKFFSFSWLKIGIIFLCILFVLSLSLLIYFFYQNQKISFSLEQFQEKQTIKIPELAVSPVIEPIDEQKEEKPESKPEPVILKKEIKAHVLNATVLTGKARKLQLALEQEGYQIPFIGNASTRNNGITKIQSPNSLEKHAIILKDSLSALGINSSLEFVDRNIDHLIIMIGNEGLTTF